MGITSIVSFNSPTSKKSTKFIEISIEIIEIRDIPQAVLKALTNFICLTRINVSRPMEKSIPLVIAKISKLKGWIAISVIWKNNIVPISPMAQPSKHHNVFFDALRHVFWHFQSSFFWLNNSNSLNKNFYVSLETINL